MWRRIVSPLIQCGGVVGLIIVFLVGVRAEEKKAQPAAKQVEPGTLITNSIGMKLAYIPPGEFLMGASKEEKEGIERLFRQFPGAEIEWLEEEYPPRRVRITKPFYLGVYEVRQGEYERVMGTNPSVFSKEGTSPYAELWADVSGMDTSRFPAENVTWYEAVKFCQKLSSLPDEQRAGRVYRLPTEAEWEYACRAGTTAPFHFGRELNGRQANCDGTHPYGTLTKGPSLRRTSAVGSYHPNAFGLCDMHGNVAEWCDDWHGNYLAARVDDPIGASDGSRRVARGGYWLSHAWGCRSAHRGGSSPSGRSGSLGFRVALQSNSSAPAATNAESEIAKPVPATLGGEPTNGVTLASNVAATPSAARSDPVGLDGVWKTVSAEWRGKPFEQYVGFEFQFSANQVVMTGALQRYTMMFTVDSSKKPSCMNVSGSDEKTLKWIYDVAGDTLRLCWNVSSPMKRPKSFVTDENSESMLLTLKRTGDVDRLPRGGDSWFHYLGGGMYCTGSPAMSPDGPTHLGVSQTTPACKR